jgi:UDP-glucose 4-epimerase
LRYFNVVGSGEPGLYDASPHNLFPLVLKALTDGRPPRVFGTDYPTPDGSCVRDYIHVADLAEAHVVAADRIERGQDLRPVYNVGRGEGVSVLEIMEAMRQVTGIDFRHEVAERRPGDPARIAASADLIHRDLDWDAKRDLADMVSSAWRSWRQAAG